MGDWALGIGPNPQSPLGPIPNPQFYLFLKNFIFKIKKIYIYIKLINQYYT